MLQAVFSRNLFTKVSSYPELFGLTLIRLLTDVATRYALPVSHIFYSWKKRIFHDHDTYELHLKETIRDYYFCTITGFTSIFAYIVIITVVRYTSYNSSVYTYGRKDLDDEKYTKLLVISLSSIFIEAVAFWAVDFYNRKRFEGSIIDLGVEMILEHKVLLLLLLSLAVHFLQDAHVALLEYS